MATDPDTAPSSVAGVKLTADEIRHFQRMAEEADQRIATLVTKTWGRPQDEFQGRKALRVARRTAAHLRILLAAATAAGDPAVTAASIGTRCGVEPALVESVCARYVAQGLEPALQPVLTAADQLQISDWYRVHGQGVVSEVQRWLREVTPHASSADVAQSVWASFANNHLDDIIDPTDADCVWGVLARAAKRHCEAWNRYATRSRERASLDGLGGAADDGSPTRLDPPDTRETDPVVALLREDCATLFTELDGGERSDAARRAETEPGGETFVKGLTPDERHVLGKKLAGVKSVDAIAKSFTDPRDRYEVEDLWASVLRKAKAFGESGD